METTSPDEIFGRLKEIVIPYSKEMEVIADTPVHYGLRIPKAFTLGGQHYQQPYYCWVFATPESVSFSLLPQRLFPEMFAVPPALQKSLRSGSRFYFKKLSNLQEAAIAQLLQEVFILYKSRFDQA